MGTVDIHTPRIAGTSSFSGPLRVVLGTLAFPSPYPAGGVALNLASSHPGLAQVVRALFFQSRGGYVFLWNAVTGKAQAFNAALTETTDDVSTLGPIPFWAITL